MKKITLLLTAAFASLVVSASSFAAEACETATVKQTLPVPVKVVSPTDLPRSFENATVEFELTVDERGVPHDIKPTTWTSREISKRLVPVLAQWRFTPASVAGHAVSMRVVLPLKLVEGA